MIRSGGFRIPNIGEMENTDIDEIIRRYKPVSSTKTKTPKKTKPVAKAKAKTKNPRVKTKRKSPVGRRINMRGGPLGLEDLINDEQTIGQVPDSVRERFKPPAFDRSKLEEAIANARIEKETGGVDSSPFPESNRFDPNAPKPEPLPRSHPFFQSEAYKKFTTHNADGMDQFVTMDMYTSSDGHQFGSGSVGRMYERWLDENPSYREGTLGPKVDSPPQSREEILKSIAGILGGSGSSGPIRSGIFKDAIYPGDSGYEEALAESKLSDSGGGGLFGGGRNLAPELIQRIKEAQEARRATGGGGLFGLIGGGQRTPEASFQNPFLGQMQMQQPINPIVGFQDDSQPKFPDIPQFMQKAAGETFGGYGGLPSIKPIMQYAGMGDSPSAPPTMNKQRPLPRPPYNPDAQPGGPPPPKLIPRPLAKIMRSIFT